MSRTLTATDRSALIRLASTLPEGSAERRAILAGLVAGTAPTNVLQALIRSSTEDLGDARRRYDLLEEEYERVGLGGVRLLLDQWHIHGQDRMAVLHNYMDPLTRRAGLSKQALSDTLVFGNKDRHGSFFLTAFAFGSTGPEDDAKFLGILNEEVRKAIRYETNFDVQSRLTKNEDGVLLVWWSNNSFSTPNAMDDDDMDSEAYWAFENLMSDAFHNTARRMGIPHVKRVGHATAVRAVSGTPERKAILAGLSKSALTVGTVRAFLEVASSKLTQYDQKIQARQPNPYRLGHYFKALSIVRDDVHDVLDDAGPEALGRLRASFERRFIDLPPITATIKQIDQYLASGKMPSLVRR